MTHVLWRTPENGWQRFWSQGGWWRAVLAVVAYLAIYLGLSLLIGKLFGQHINRNVLADPQSVLLALALPILLGGIVLAVFARSLRWLGELFGPQPIRGSWWMWIAVPLLIIPIVIRGAATNWAAYSVGVVPLMLLTGLFIGFAEELLTRGFAVDLLRRGGHGERLVMVVSSLLFALSHSVNAFTQPPLLVLITVVYTFGFGTMMYLVMRATGSIVWAMVLHAATDPTTFLATGGVDSQSATAGSATLISAASIFNYVYILFAVVAIIIVRGRVRSVRAGDPGDVEPEAAVGDNGPMGDFSART